MRGKGSDILSAVYQKAFDLSEDLYTSQNRTELINFFFDKVEEIIPHETAVCFPIDPVRLAPSTTGHITKNYSNGDEIGEKYGSYYYALDPIKQLSHIVNTNSAVCYSDVMPIGKVMDGEFYQDFLKPIGISYTIGCHISFHGEPGYGMGLHRPYGAPDFSDRDKKIFNLLAPHLAHSIHYCELREKFNEPLPLVSMLKSSGLSPRESEVASLVVRGLKNHEIADRLCISEQTVKDHLRSVYRKARVANRAQLILKLLNSSAPIS